MPTLLDSKLPLLVPLARALPGHYRFTPAKDLADEIEWAKSRRLTPTTYERAVAARATPGASRRSRSTCSSRLFAGYERAKTRAGRIDFDDLLIDTVDLLEGDAEAAATVRARKRWFSVDEYQDTNPLQQRLLELWLGERPDLCVVGDEDQTIYTFTGATSTFLTAFAERHPGRAGRHARARTTARRRRSSRSRTGCSRRRAGRSGWSRRARRAGADHRRGTRRRRPKLAALSALDRANGSARASRRRRSRCSSG